MRALLALLLAFPATGSSVLQAQTDYYARLGATYATNLLRDVIFQEIHVRQSVAPTLVLGASLPITPVYRAGLEATLTSSGVPQHRRGHRDRSRYPPNRIGPAQPGGADLAAGELARRARAHPVSAG